MDAATDLDLLAAHGITIVVNCAVNADFNYVDRPLSPAGQAVSFGYGGLRYYKLGLVDGPGNPETMVLAGYFLLKGALEQEVPEKASYPLPRRGNVLVNCRAGRSRSVMLVALFLSVAEKARFPSFEAALRHVREKRELRPDEWIETPKQVLLEAAKRARHWIGLIEADRAGAAGDR
jgi:protein-tyrosine phosphatase